jgi:hypothetical protein
MSKYDDAGRKKIEEAWNAIDDKYILEAADHTAEQTEAAGRNRGELKVVRGSRNGSGRSRIVAWMGAGIAAVVVLVVAGIGTVSFLNGNMTNKSSDAVNSGNYGTVLDNYRPAAEQENAPDNYGGEPAVTVIDKDGLSEDATFEPGGPNKATYVDDNGYATELTPSHIGEDPKNEAGERDDGGSARVNIYAWKEGGEYMFVVLMNARRYAADNGERTAESGAVLENVLGEEEVLAYLKMARVLDKDDFSFEVLPVSELEELLGVSTGGEDVSDAELWQIEAGLEEALG